MNEDTIRFLIEQKVSLINAASSACMSWWVTSTLFSGSILATIWAKRSQITRNKKFVFWLGLILFVFFSSIVFYGFMMTHFLYNVQSEIDILVANLKPETAYLHIELSAFFWAMIAGTSSFVLVLVAWFFLWKDLLNEAENEANLKNSQPKDKSAVEQVIGREGETVSL